MGVCLFVCSGVWLASGGLFVCSGVWLASGGFCLFVLVYG